MKLGWKIKISFTNNLNSKIIFLNKIRKISKGNINIDSDYYKKFLKERILFHQKLSIHFKKMSWHDVQKLMKTVYLQLATTQS